MSASKAPASAAEYRDEGWTSDVGLVLGVRSTVLSESVGRSNQTKNVVGAASANRRAPHPRALALILAARVPGSEGLARSAA